MSFEEKDIITAWRESVGATFDAASPLETVRPPADEDTPTVSPPAPPPGAGLQAGFSLLGKLGQGGMGVVYRAEQKVLRREVAFKQPLDSRAAVTSLFTAEALVTGFLEHPNIVPIHHLGVDDQGRTFFTMKLVQGISWKDLLHPENVREGRAGVEARAKAMDQEAHLRTLLAVSNAVAFAHARNILHRDLKPENVMIGDFGEVLVMDWGIAVDMSAEPPAQGRTVHCTMSGLGGTPAYMAPEMARGDGKRFGPWTDVYLLGAVLHEILTGRPPHRGANLKETLAHAVESPAPVLEGAPAELAAVCRKAMARETADRYPDVRSFQAALEGYLKHRQSTLISERAALEEKGLDTSAAQPARVVYEALSRLLARWEQARELWDGNEAARLGALRVRRVFAQVALERGDLELARSHADQLPSPGGDELRANVAREKAARAGREEAARATRRALAGVGAALFVSLAVGFLWIRAERNQKVVEARRADENAALARQESAAAVKARDQEAGERRTAQIRLAESQVYRAQALGALGDYQPAFDLLGEALELRQKIGAGTDPVRVALLDHVSRYGLPLWDVGVADADTGAWALAFSPDGRRLAAGGAGFVSVRDVLTGRQLSRSSCSARGLAWTPDGQALLATWSETALIDAATGEVRRSLEPRTAALRAAVTPDGRLGVVGGDSGEIRVWDLATGALVRTMKGLERPIPVLRVSRDGRRLFTGTSEQRAAEIRTWDFTSGQVLDTYEWHTQHCTAGAFAEDGAFAVAGAKDTIVRVLDLKKKEERHALSGHHEQVSCVEVVPGTFHALSGGNDHAVRLWNVDGGNLVRELGWHTGAVSALAASPDARWAASADDRGHVALWPLAAAGPVRPLNDPARDPGEHTASAVSPDGSVCVTASETGTLSLWNPVTGRVRDRLPPPARLEPRLAALRRANQLWGFLCKSEGISVASMAFSTTSILQLARTDGVLETWNLEKRTLDRTRTTTGTATIDARGRYAAILERESTLRLVELSTGRTLAEKPTGRRLAAHAMALSESGDHLLLAQFAPTNPKAPKESQPPQPLPYALWDTRANTLRDFGNPDDYTTSVAIAPDGRTAFTLAQSRCTLWDLKTLTPLLTPREVYEGTAAYSPDGAYAYLGSRFARDFHVLELSPPRVVLSRPLAHGTNAITQPRSGSYLFLANSEGDDALPPSVIDLDRVLRQRRAWRAVQSSLSTLSTAPDDPGSLYRLGCWFADLHAIPLAREALESARRADPTGAQIPLDDVTQRLAAMPPR